MRALFHRHIASRLRERFHEARADLFLALTPPRPGASILDLGGGDGSFAARIRARTDVSVTVADLDATHRAAVERRGFRHVRLREGEPIPFQDGEFDVVLCNSVIEHVTLPKADCLSGRYAEQEWRARALERQTAFAREIRRVGKGYFVQTPHKHFPIDVHTLLPFTNWLSHDHARRLVAVTDRYWIKYCGCADWHLLGAAEMRRLFPAGEVHVERLAGLPKSIVAYRTAEGTA